MSSNTRKKKCMEYHVPSKKNRHNIKKPELGKEAAIHFIISLYFSHLAVMLAIALRAVIGIRQVVISNNLLYLLSALLLPLLVFLLATKTEYWNYHNHKVFLYKSVVINAIAVSIQPIYTIYWRATIPWIMKIKVTAAMTEFMVHFLAQIILLAGMAVLFAVIYLLIKKLLLSEEVIEEIKAFKITHHIDERKHIENLYDLTIVNDLETSRPIRLKQNDRFLHVFVNGASGTGKTSSIFFPAILQDLKTKDRNRRERLMGLIRLLLQEKAYIDDSKGGINESSIHPVSGYEKEYHELYKQYKDCGIAVMAPDNSVVETVLKLARAKHMEVCVLDPSRTYEEYSNYKKIGINPFLIDLDLKGNALNIAVNDKAEMFAEVLLAVNERDEKSDVYFSNIMKNMCITVSKIAMLAAAIRGRQTNILDIQQCIIDPKNLIPLVQCIEQHFGIYVEANAGKTTGKTNPQARVEDFNSTPRASLDKIRKGKESPYYQDILFVKDELLGASSQEMFNQARGLRIIMNIFLSDPRIRDVLTATEEEALDLDAMLATGQLVVINTAAEFGQGKSTALGLFFLLNLKIAVFKRPQPYDELSPFFVLVDEASQYMHRSLEDFITLFRKYWVGTLFAVQGLEQFDKSDLTKYLRGVFMKTGTQYVFGRLSKEEMETYSILVGEFSEVIEQETISETSIFSENPSKSRSVRTTPDVKAKMTGTKLRQLDFQELTVLSVNNGRVLDGKLGKVHFVKKADYKEEEPFTVDWDNLKEHVLMLKDIENEKINNGVHIEMKIPDEEKSSETDAYIDSMDTSDILDIWRLSDIPKEESSYITTVAEENVADHGERIVQFEVDSKEILPDFKEEQREDMKKTVEWWNVI